MYNIGFSVLSPLYSQLLSQFRVKRFCLCYSFVYTFTVFDLEHVDLYLKLYIQVFY